MTVLTYDVDAQGSRRENRAGPDDKFGARKTQWGTLHPGRAAAAPGAARGRAAATFGPESLLRASMPTRRAYGPGYSATHTPLKHAVANSGHDPCCS